MLVFETGRAKFTALQRTSSGTICAKFLRQSSNNGHMTSVGHTTISDQRSRPVVATIRPLSRLHSLDEMQGVRSMLRKTVMAALTVLAIGLSGSAAEARGFGHGGGHFGGFHGGGFHGGGFRGAGFGLGLGFAGAYAGYGYGYPYGFGGYYPGYDEDGGYGGCHVERERVRTKRGWRWQSIDVCD
jgi:hypothetical protein